ncbi:FtsH protease activity modulator HflK [Stratiformator vulcanicus]|uniref:Protein HflK n=1 Tax=Stratiformator vulcanicus TaxID=2527980 RepID=A0A517R343_9PLAN|nr:FtsH protease activity modulator HflK [Stratiformator vulcanicus]QDT38308.1 Modulator of FtsH protease HflK [Stratiformator vulcanicus]
MARQKYDFERPEIDPAKLVWPVTAGALLFVLAILGYWSFYTVEPNEQAVVMRFGRYHATTLPGLHFKIPVVDSVLKVSVEERSMRLPTGDNGSRPGQIDEADTLMLTGDLNAASVEWTVQWKVSDPKDYLFAFQDQYLFEQVVRTIAQAVMNRLVGDYSIDEILTAKRAEVAVAARKATQAILDQYQCGVTVTDLQMQRVTPPLKVKPAFDQVNAAVQQRDRLENEAEKERKQLLPLARANRDKRIKEAQGYAERRRAEVEGELSALRAKYDAYKQAPEVTRERLYLEAMQNVLENVDRKVVIDSDLQQILPLLQLDDGGSN